MESSSAAWISVPTERVRAVRFADEAGLGATLASDVPVEAVSALAVEAVSAGAVEVLSGNGAPVVAGAARRLSGRLALSGRTTAVSGALRTRSEVALAMVSAVSAGTESGWIRLAGVVGLVSEGGTGAYARTDVSGAGRAATRETGLDRLAADFFARVEVDSRDATCCSAGETGWSALARAAAVSW